MTNITGDSPGYRTISAVMPAIRSAVNAMSEWIGGHRRSFSDTRSSSGALLLVILEIIVGFMLAFFQAWFYWSPK